ncbi:MAG: RodZ domain-containing protein [Parcubacteria group bacterium]|jgi:cytoskeletal protein RodZ
MINSGFTKKRVGTMTLGEKLKKLRADKRISLGEISRVTRIQIIYLESLEEGDYNSLPADVYVKGFLRSYADFMGVEEKALVKLYEKERGIKNHLERSKNPQKEKKKEPISISSFVFTPKKIVLVSSVLLVFLGVFYLYREIGSFADSPRLLILSPQANAAVDGNSVTVEGVTDKDAKLFVNDQPILVNDDGKFRETITMQPGVSTINVKSVNKFDKESVASVTVKSGSGEEVAGEMDVNGNGENNTDGSKNNDEINMELRVDPGPVWLSVEADGSLVFSGTMLTGATQTFKGNDKIVINSGKGNATFLKFNGKDIGPLSQDPGAVRGATFNKDTKY